MLIYDFETNNLIVAASGRVLGTHATLTDAASMFPGVVINLRNTGSHWHCADILPENIKSTS